MSFDKIIEFTLKWEGKFVDDKDDPGGATNMGIALKYLDEDIDGDGDIDIDDIKNLTVDEAKDYYKRKYWEPFNDIRDDTLHMVAFDSAVNMGVSRIKGFLNGCHSGDDLIKRREEYYHNLTIKKPVMKKYLKGWLNRTRALREFVKC